MLNRIEHADQIVELNLARPPVNALNAELVSALDEALKAAFETDAAAVVLSGAPGMFSAGLDVPALLPLDRDGMRDFWSRFFGLLGTIAGAPVPVVAALTGHSPAGGTVLGLFADYRVMAEGDFKIGLNEVQVGLVVPPLIHFALARLIGVYPAERHLVAGRMISAGEARGIGLVDELAPVEEVVERALAWCRYHLSLPRHAMLGTRRLTRAELVARADAFEAMNIEGFVDLWFQEETQAALNAMVARLKA